MAFLAMRLLSIAGIIPQFRKLFRIVFHQYFGNVGEFGGGAVGDDGPWETFEFREAFDGSANSEKNLMCEKWVQAEEWLIRL